MCSHLFFFSLPCIFISMVVFCKSSGHFGMRFRRKSEYCMTLPYTHPRAGKRLERARKKPQGAWARRGHKGHSAFSHECYRCLSVVYFSLFMALCCASASTSFFTELWNVGFGGWTMRITKTYSFIILGRKAKA